MKYYLFALRFLTPVHFGEAAAGGKLEKIKTTCSADTFFSALVNEKVQLGFEPSDFIAKFANCEVTLSSLFPYYCVCDEKNSAIKELELYIPKPFVRGTTRLKIKDYEEGKKIATELKKLKKSSYVRVSEIESLLDSMTKGEKFVPQTRNFMATEVMPKVLIRKQDSKPYYVGTTSFFKHSGLYFVAGFEDDRIVNEFISLVRSLGFSGIGGKRSSGYGKFELFVEPMALADSKFRDAEILESMLNNQDAILQMALAPICPSEITEDALDGSYYKLMFSSGFTVADNDDNMTKRDSFLMFAEGSCFSKRIKGTMKKLNVFGVTHPVYRNGMGVFLGVNYRE